MSMTKEAIVYTLYTTEVRRTAEEVRRTAEEVRRTAE